MSEMETRAAESVGVTIPARPDFVHVARSVVAGVAARADFSYDEIDDLRLAVDEACAQLIGAGEAGGSLSLEISPATGEVAVIAALDAPGGEWPPAGLRRTLAWQVLSALVDEVELDLMDGVPAVRLLKRKG